MQVAHSALSFSLHRLQLQFSEELVSVCVWWVLWVWLHSLPLPQSDPLSYVAAARMAVLCAELLEDEAHRGKIVDMCVQV